MPGAITLREAGGNSDAAYTGESGESALSFQYYRDKATEYQNVLNALDAGYQSLNRMLAIPLLDWETVNELQRMAAEYDDRRFALKATAEAINLGAATINAAGGRFPQLSIPATLGFALPAIPFAAVAAFATAASLMVWGREWLIGYNQRAKLAQQLDAQDSPAAKAELAREVAASDGALAIAQESGLAAVAPIIKWVALGIGAFMLYKVVQPYLKG